MPGMDGFEATVRIREREAILGVRIPTIAMTTHACAEQCFAAGIGRLHLEADRRLAR